MQFSPTFVQFILIHLNPVYCNRVKMHIMKKEMQGYRNNFTSNISYWGYF